MRICYYSVDYHIFSSKPAFLILALVIAIVVPSFYCCYHLYKTYKIWKLQVLPYIFIHYFHTLSFLQNQSCLMLEAECHSPFWKKKKKAFAFITSQMKTTKLKFCSKFCSWIQHQCNVMSLEETERQIYL